MSLSGEPLRIGVCGNAYWAEHVHLPALNDHAGFRLTGLFGRTPARLEELASRFRIEAYDSFEAFLETVDAVSFAVPPETQARLAPIAANAGKHLILEKPVALSPEAADKIAHAVKAARIGAVCFLTRNFIPELKDFIAAARAEGPRTARATFHSSALTAGSPYAGSEWRQARNASLWDSGPHLLTCLLNLFGPPNSIAVRSMGDGGLEGTLRHADGKTSGFVINQTMPLGPLQEVLTVETSIATRRFENRQYDRLAAFRAAASRLLQSAAGDVAAARAFQDAVDMVRILASGERSLGLGGIEVATTGQ